MAKALACKELLSRLFSAFGSVASVLGLLFTLKLDWHAWGLWQTLFAASSVICFGILCALEFKTHSGKYVFSVSDKIGIRDYMYSWLCTGERVAIWSRDLSWVNDDSMRELLERKAKAHELIICVPTPTNLTNELQRKGAKICAYADSRLNPGSRFTIIHLGKDGARVAVGRTEGKRHVIEEFAAGEHPAFHMAADLVELARFKCSTE